VNGADLEGGMAETGFWKNRLAQKSMIADGDDAGMRYPASEKLEINPAVEDRHRACGSGTLEQPRCLNARLSIAG